MEMSKLHRELRISYLQYRLSRIPHGYFGVNKGRRTVYVTFDPDDPKVSIKNKRRFLTDTPAGIMWGRLIEDYLKTESELRSLTDAWSREFWCEPRRIEYPLCRKETVRMDNRFYEQLVPNLNEKENKYPIGYKGQILRSKNELLLCQMLENMGYEYKIEVCLGDDDFCQLYPDVTFLVPEIERCISVELDGAMENISYKNKSEYRRMNYLNAGFREDKDIIFLRMPDSRSFDMSLARDSILYAIERNISDIDLGGRQAAI